MLNQRFSALLFVTVATMAVASVVLTYGLLFGSKTITSQGNVHSVGVGVYWENTCVNEVTAIDWGLVEPGASVNVTVYILNDGTVPMTLNMTTDNWDPAAASPDITLSWNCEGSSVSAQSVSQAVLTLSVSPSISNVSSFSFDITITGSE
jgi:hypothetical protein